MLKDWAMKFRCLEMHMVVNLWLLVGLGVGLCLLAIRFYD